MSNPDSPISAADSLRLNTQGNGYRSVSPETSIPPLLYALGGHVPKAMLERAVSPQQRWGRHGVERRTTLQHAGLDAHLKELLSDERKLWKAIERLLLLSVVSVEELDGIETYICGWESTQFPYDRTRSYWVHQAFEIFCYAFPRSQIEYSL